MQGQYLFRWQHRFPCFVHFTDTTKTLGVIFAGEFRHLGTGAPERMEIIAGSWVVLSGTTEL
jgi:uncharacterized protein YaiE (UPF0345 family)